MNSSYFYLFFTKTQRGGLTLTQTNLWFIGVTVILTKRPFSPTVQKNLTSSPVTAPRKR